jgi:hypothetical protein
MLYSILSQINKGLRRIPILRNLESPCVDSALSSDLHIFEISTILDKSASHTRPHLCHSLSGDPEILSAGFSKQVFH